MTRLSPISAAGRACLAAAALLTLAAPAAAQSLWLPRDTGTFVRLEGYRPALDRTNLESLSSGWFLTGQWPVDERLDVVVEVPFGYGHETRAFGEEKALDHGNPYLGARWADGEGTFLDFGVRLPLGSVGVGARVGQLADLERVATYGDDVGLLRARGGRGAAVSEDVMLEPSVGYSLLLGSGGTASFGHYGAVLRGHPGPYHWSLGATGLLQLSSGGTLEQRTFHHAGAAVGRDLGPLRLALIGQVPIAEEHAADWIAGFAAQWRIH